MAARIHVNPLKGGVCAAVARAAVLASVVTVVATCSYGERTYSADSIDSRVVDADSGEPLAGVNVVAEWVLKGGVESGEVTGYANVMETVTDEDGRFHFPAWGPVTVKRGSVREAGPALLLFKPGYHYAAYANASSAEAPSHLISRWSTKDLKLKRNSGYVEATSDDWTAVHVQVENLVTHRLVKKVKKFVCQVAEEGDRQKLSKSSFLGITSADLDAFDVECKKGQQ
jgi:hypothetical protein